MTFQGLIFKLSEFWASRGCTIQQPLDTEVGAGTMHPETFLRVLGPAHWNVAYVQPSRRPADGRFGENPNRSFKHHQFQVILKPAPDEVQQLYLESLEACGINPRQHDIRFEEDNWESPTLGAWGIGWQVLFDGMEISQFTYFQQAGSLELAPISAELTYGLERIAMALQRVDSMFDLEWSDGVKYRDVRLREEIEQSKYVFGQVDMPPGEFARFHRHMFDEYYGLVGAAAQVGADLAGARTLSEVLASVQHPRFEQQHRRHGAHGLHSASQAAGGRHRQGLRRRDPRQCCRGERIVDRELLLEIGCEELPASWLPGLTSQIGDVVVSKLKDQRLAPETPVETYSTPRRLTVRVGRLAERQTDLEELVNGPPVSASFGADGTPTQAATGFATRNGTDVASLERVETPKGVYLAFRKKQRGKAAVDVLPEVLRATLRGLAFPKSMRWDAMLDDGGGELLFGRPIRWILFLYGGRVVPFTISRTPAAQNSQVQDVTSGAVTYGHRFLTTSGRAGRAIKVRSFDDYRSRLLENFVVLEHEERHNKIASALDANAQRLHGRVSRAVRAESSLLDEVPDLIEYPGVVAGTFSHEFLELPEEVLTTTLIHHQHYFPVEGEDGRLKNAFLAVINTEPENPRIDCGECGARRHGAPSGREILLGDRPACDARIAAGSFVDAAVSQEARQLPREGRSHRASGATDCDGAFSRVRGRGEPRRTRRQVVEGRSHHRHGS